MPADEIQHVPKVGHTHLLSPEIRGLVEMANCNVSMVIGLSLSVLVELQHPSSRIKVYDIPMARNNADQRYLCSRSLSAAIHVSYSIVPPTNSLPVEVIRHSNPPTFGTVEKRRENSDHFV